MSERPKAASKARRLLREREELLTEIGLSLTRARQDELAVIERELLELVPLLLNIIENGGAPGVPAKPWLTERRKRQKDRAAREAMERLYEQRNNGRLADHVEIEYRQLDREHPGD